MEVCFYSVTICSCLHYQCALHTHIEQYRPLAAAVNNSADEDDKGEDDFGLRPPTLIQQLKNVLNQYPDNGQIIKVSFFVIFTREDCFLVFVACMQILLISFKTVSPSESFVAKNHQKLCTSPYDRIVEFLLLSREHL